MPDAHSLLLFIGAGLLLNLTPGPDVLYIVSRSLRSGVRAGIVAGLGIGAGCFVHISAAALGLSALMAASSTAFSLLKWVGAAYLIYIGLRMLLARPARQDGAPAAASAPSVASTAPAAPTVPGPAEAASFKSIFLGGFWTNALNPKVALFFLAFVPQFIAPDAAHKGLDFFLLGTLFNFNALFVSIGWALAAGWTAGRLGAVRRGMQSLERGAGALFIAFGLRLALADPPSAAPAIH